MSDTDQILSAISGQLARIERRQYQMQQTIWVLISIAVGVIGSLVLHFI